MDAHHRLIIIAFANFRLVFNWAVVRCWGSFVTTNLRVNVGWGEEGTPTPNHPTQIFIDHIKKQVKLKNTPHQKPSVFFIIFRIPKKYM